MAKLTLVDHAKGVTKTFDDIGVALKYAGNPGGTDEKPEKALTHFRINDEKGGTVHLVENGDLVVDGSKLAAKKPTADE